MALLPRSRGTGGCSEFFKVGGASGTVAKTMSAYDMKFSDAIYGVGDRYVCEERLIRMLDHEYVYWLKDYLIASRRRGFLLCGYCRSHQLRTYKSGARLDGITIPASSAK